MRTHYQNLKVAEDAPQEVIKAAWRSLSHQHHPDKNQGDPKAVQVMQIINDAYEELTDPVKRRAHDEAIRKSRSRASQSSPQGRHSASMPKERQWWIWKDGAGMTGPYTLALLMAQQRTGHIHSRTFVCETGTKNRMPLAVLLKILNQGQARYHRQRKRSSSGGIGAHLWAFCTPRTVIAGAYVLYVIYRFLSQ